MPQSEPVFLFPRSAKRVTEGSVTYRFGELRRFTKFGEAAPISG
jgi:hypothetical protein